MGNLRIPHAVLLLALLPHTLAAPQQAPRPTRTLGSLFGSKTPAQPPPQQPVPLQQQQQKPVRPLVYQVKYYERGPNGIQTNVIDIPDARNYGTIDKSGVVVDQQSIGGNIIVGQPPIIQPPRVLYYNPLIPPQQETTPVYYTLTTVGNTQVLVPCSSPPDQLVYESNVALNVEHPQQKPIVPVPALRAPTNQVIQQQQQPLVREQVVAAAAELSQYGNLPGSGVVGAGINSVPYGYYYYYYIPPTPTTPTQHQQVPILTPQDTRIPIQQQVLQPQVIQPQVNNYPFYNPYTRIIPQQQSPVIPVYLSGGVPSIYNPYQPQVIVPQASTVKEQQQQRPQQQQQPTRVQSGTKVEGQHK